MCVERASWSSVLLPHNSVRILMKGRVMAEDFTDSELEEGVLDPRFREVVRAASKKSKRLDELERQVARYELDKVFDEVGVPVDGPGLLFREKYDGDRTAPAVKDAAYTYGIIQRPSLTDPAVAEELARLRALNSGSNDSRNDPVGDREAEWARRISVAANEQELMAIYKEIEATQPS